MSFTDYGSPLGRDGFEHACAIANVDAATLWAVLSVESSGFGFLPSRRPVILFERHIFHRLTDGRFDGEDSDISNPIPGGYRGGAAEYSRLDRASALDLDAALQSTSWGLGQLLGCNYEHCGYPDVQSMVAEMKICEDDQIWAVARYIVEWGLSELLQEQRWAEFASHYNGPDFQRTDYDVKLAAAHARYQQRLPDLEIRFGQAALFYLGFNPGPIDGFMGPRTRAALIAFERKRGWQVTARMNERMLDRLCLAAF
jgi:N-acetylmuramidase/Putative peptidoglycan binding domain